MEIALVASRLILALVFLIAGVAKLADRAGARKSMIDFGLPPLLATPLGLLLPICELICAGTLFPAVTAWWGAAGVLALLVIFIAGISVNMALGRAPDCHCFGQLHSAPAGWKTLARNLILSAVAAVILWQGRATPQPALLGWTRLLSATQAVLLACTAVVVGLLLLNLYLLLEMLSQNGRMLLRIEAIEKKLGMDARSAQPAGLAVGAPAPGFSLSGLDGTEVALDALRAAGLPVMLFFTDPNCTPCDALLPEVAGWQRAHAGKLNFALISRGDPEPNRSRMVQHGLERVLLQKDREVAEAYLSTATPGAVLVNADGRIGSPLALGDEAIRALVASATRPEPVKKGESAPDLRLPDLDGKTADLKNYRGSSTLLLFWNPGCGFCRQVLEDIKAWERKRPKDAPKLLVVSTGTPEKNRAEGFRAPVVLDKNFSAGHAFGADGTPSAVLIAPDGKVASEVAAGTGEVLRLLRESRFEIG